MIEYTVVFRKEGKNVFTKTTMAESEQQALDNTCFIPYFHGVEYDEQEAWPTFGKETK